ncbi:MAG: HDOD domain-containing protein [Helicobacteraceae bacterium]|nr:HDOD domain-containing protein [Helicobacteraceae bacterium]
MITKDKVTDYIKKIPPTSDALVQAMKILHDGDLVKAGKVAEEDLALKAYLTDLMNKPIFGFKQEVTNINQIFGILGLQSSEQSLYTYMVSLLNPDKWQLFNLNKNSFHDLQAELTVDWEKILKHKSVEDKDVSNAISLLPSSIIVTDALFGDVKNEVTLLRSAKNLDYNTILQRVSGMTLFDICNLISKKWKMSEKSMEIVYASSGVKPSTDEDLNELGKWMHLLLFFTLSKPKYIEAGLNDFLTFNAEYVQDIYMDFMDVLEIEVNR